MSASTGPAAAKFEHIGPALDLLLAFKPLGYISYRTADGNTIRDFTFLGCSRYHAAHLGITGSPVRTCSGYTAPTPHHQRPWPNIPDTSNIDPDFPLLLPLLHVWPPCKCGASRSLGCPAPPAAHNLGPMIVSKVDGSSRAVACPVCAGCLYVFLPLYVYLSPGPKGGVRRGNCKAELFLIPLSPSFMSKRPPEIYAALELYSYSASTVLVPLLLHGPPSCTRATSVSRLLALQSSVSNPHWAEACPAAAPRRGAYPPAVLGPGPAHHRPAHPSDASRTLSAGRRTTAHRTPHAVRRAHLPHPLAPPACSACPPAQSSPRTRTRTRTRTHAHGDARTRTRTRHSHARRRHRPTHPPLLLLSLPPADPQAAAPTTTTTTPLAIQAEIARPTSRVLYS
ncbi:hypothetical protein DFH27DRAFT_526892 [Peziza echinospora]|nr:hypothetical protein DFH27DRAFT_526892 [Peziza echinospora]